MGAIRIEVDLDVLGDATLEDAIAAVRAWRALQELVPEAAGYALEIVRAEGGWYAILQGRGMLTDGSPTPAGAVLALAERVRG